MIVLAGIVSAPTFAANIKSIPCVKSTKATLEVPADALAPKVVNHAASTPVAHTETNEGNLEAATSNAYLAPRAEAAIRQAFENPPEIVVESTESLSSQSLATPPMAGRDSTPKPADSDARSNDENAVMNTRLPGVSNTDLLRYKKLMYRRDI